MSGASWAIEEWYNQAWRVVGEPSETFTEQEMLGYLNSHFSLTFENGSQSKWQVESVTRGKIILSSRSSDGTLFRHRFIRR